MKDLRVPIEKVTVRPSDMGELFAGVDFKELTEVQERDYKALKQKYKSYKEKGKTLARTDLTKLNNLIEKKRSKPELTQGGKTLVKKYFARKEYLFDDSFYSPQTDKGIDGEQYSIDLTNDILNPIIPLIKNKKWGYGKNTRGICDSLQIQLDGIKNVFEYKSKFSSYTYIKTGKADIKHITQGHTYLYIYDADYCYLIYTLVNSPPALCHEDHKKDFFYKGIIDDSLPRYKKQVINFFRKHIVDFEEFDKIANQYPPIMSIVRKELEPIYTKEERLKYIKLKRDKSFDERIEVAVNLFIEYYKTLSLDNFDTNPKNYPKYIADTIVD